MKKWEAPHENEILTEDKIEKFIKELKYSPVDSQNAEIKGKLLKEICLSEF